MITFENCSEIKLYSKKVAKQIEALPIQLRARMHRVFDLIKMYGPNLGMPHTRAMGRGLFEARAKSSEGISRALFCLSPKMEVVVLNVFLKKTNKTPKRELDLAVKRFKEISV